MTFLSPGESVVISDCYPMSTIRRGGAEMEEFTTFAQEHGMEQLQNFSTKLEETIDFYRRPHNFRYH